jgi:hypothetical protein
MKVGGMTPTQYKLFWKNGTQQTTRSWNDLEEATEYAAYGMAILLMNDLTNSIVVEKSRKGTGFDYWLGDPNDPLFQKKKRLEVSGILKGKASSVTTRVIIKSKKIPQMLHQYFLVML